MEDEINDLLLSCRVTHHNFLNDCVGNVDQLNIAYINAQSIRANKLQAIEHFLNSMNCEIHILVITETWLTENEEKFYNLFDYNSFYSSRSTGYGGTAIFVKSYIPATFVLKNDVDFCNTLIVRLVNLNFNIISFYRSPKNHMVNFTDLLESICSSYSKSIIIGDINLNLLNNDKDAVNYKNILATNGYVILNKIAPEYITRSSNLIGTIIDHVITSLLNIQYDISLADTSLSDHKFLLLRMNKTISKPNSFHTKTVIDYENIFNDRTWFDILNSSSFDKMITSFTNLVKSHTKVITKRYKNHKSWINKDIIDLIKNREKFFHLKKKAPNNEYVTKKYEFYSKQVVYKIRVAKNSENSKIIEHTVNKPMELWKQLKLLMFNKVSKINMIYLSDGSHILDNSHKIADKFNEQFVDAPLSITGHFPNVCVSDFSYVAYQITSKLDFYEVSSKEVVNIISSLNPSAATGLDQISTKMLKFCSSKIADKISILLNEMFRSGQFPNSFKKAKVVPIFKKGNNLDPNNYRPISILSAFSKIAENAILSRFNEFLLKNNIIYSQQFGFIKNSNTMAACLNLTNFLSINLDKKKYVGAFFLDLKKAFDTVDHHLLLLKLGKLDLNEKQLKLFSSYLSNRSQQVTVNDVASTFLNIKIGVPQGSILGPCLFLFFINDLSLLHLSGSLQLYADDAVLLYSSSSQQNLCQQMQSDLSMIETWFSTNRLVLNHDKTKCMFFGNKIYSDYIFQNLKYDGNQIMKVESINYLGLIIDNKLKWNDHINNIKSSIIPYIFAINKIKHYLPKEPLMLIYNAYILSRLTYLSPIWSGCSQNKLNDLVILQKKVLKFIIRVPYLYPTILLFSHFISLEILFTRNLLVLIYQMINGLIKHNLDILKVTDLHHYGTRRISHYRVDSFSTSMSNNNVLYRGLLKFNSLPSEIKSAKSISIFKIQILNYLKNN